jgi:hypothetical protein
LIFYCAIIETHPLRGEVLIQRIPNVIINLPHPLCNLSMRKLLLLGFLA